MTMSRAPVFPVEEKVRVVLSILAGELSVAEAARRAKVSEQSVGNWKRQFLEAGRAGLVAGWALRGPRGSPSGRGHADLEVLCADRHARADLAPPPGPGPDRGPGQGTVAATGPVPGP